MRGRLNLATQLKTATQQGLLSVVLFIRTSLLVYFPILDVLLFRTPADRGHFGSSLRAANSEQTAFSKERITVLHGMQQMTPQQLRTGHKGPGQNLAFEFARHGGAGPTKASAEKWLPQSGRTLKAHQGS